YSSTRAAQGTRMRRPTLLDQTAPTLVKLPASMGGGYAMVHSDSATWTNANTEKEELCDRRAPKRAGELRELAVALHELGYPWRMIGRLLGCSHTNVMKVLRATGYTKPLTALSDAEALARLPEDLRKRVLAIRA